MSFSLLWSFLEVILVIFTLLTTNVPEISIRTGDFFHFRQIYCKNGKLNDIH